MSAEGIANILNTALLGTSREDELERLKREIERKRSELRDLLLVKSRTESQTASVLTERAAEGFLKCIEGCNTDLSGQSGMEKVSISFFEVPIRYHVMHGSYSVGNNNVVYVTQPIYAFKAVFMNNSTVRLSNITYMYAPEDSLVEGWSSSTYSHPHVSDRNNGEGYFSHICFGQNKFLEDIHGTTITPQSFLEFARRFYIWATHGNLNDMYDSPAYRDPKLSSAAREIVRQSEDLFLLAQKSIGSASERPKLISAVRDAGLQANSYEEAFIRAYAAWFIKNAPALSNACGYLNRHSLLASARLDIVAEVDTDRDFSPLTEEILGAPVALKKLMERQLSNSSSNTATTNAAVRDILSKFII